MTDDHKNDHNNSGDNTGNASNNSGNQLLRLKLPERLQNEKIVQDFNFDSDDYFRLVLNHADQPKKIVFQFDWRKKKFQENLESFGKRLENKGIEKKYTAMITETVEENIDEIIEFRKNSEAEEEGEGENNQHPKEIYIRKYTGNGTLSLHESVVIAGQPSTFLHLGDDRRPQYTSKIETGNKVFYPADTMDTQNPIPYNFVSTKELQEYLDLASKETFETLHRKVETVYKKYVNAEEHCITVLQPIQFIVISRTNLEPRITISL